MKKTLLAAALIAGFAGVAQAETSVTLYGLVDAGLGYSASKATFGNSVTKTTEIGLQNGVQSGNRWGLKGTEDLGNGTAAIFQLESGFNLGTGASAQGGALFGRKAIVGLTGDSWGTFTIGKQYNVADDVVAGFDPFSTGFGQASAQSTFGDYLSSRMTNSFKYLTPNLAGFEAGIAYSGAVKNVKTNGVKVEGTDNHNTISLGLGYNNGPIGVGASYDRIRANTFMNPNSDVVVNAWNVGGSYDFNVVKASLMYGEQRNGINNDFITVPTNGALFTSAGTKEVAFTEGLNTVKGLKQQSWLAGLTAPVGDAAKVMFSYQGSRITKNADFAKATTSIYSLGYTQSLSKRTNVYAVASYGLTKAKAIDYKNQSTQASVGVRHQF